MGDLYVCSRTTMLVKGVISTAGEVQYTEELYPSRDNATASEKIMERISVSR